MFKPIDLVPDIIRYVLIKQLKPIKYYSPIRVKIRKLIHAEINKIVNA